MSDNISAMSDKSEAKDLNKKEELAAADTATHRRKSLTLVGTSGEADTKTQLLRQSSLSAQVKRSCSVDKHRMSKDPK